METPTKYWFKRRRYGFGWTPTTWQGWLILVVYIVAMVAVALMMGVTGSNTYRHSLQFVEPFLFVFVVATIILIAILSAKSPSPKWRWGKKDGDNPHEDF
jgi:hypothetical protein